MTTVYPSETNSGVVTSWIPLTTIFTPPADCSHSLKLNGRVLVAYDPLYGVDVNTAATTCGPRALTQWWGQTRLGNGNKPGDTLVSLGPLICPWMWSTLSTSVKDKISTEVMCCPPGFFLANGMSTSFYGNCQSNVSSAMVFTYAATSSGSTDWFSATTTLTTRSYVGAVPVVGWNVRRENSAASIPTGLPTLTSPLDLPKSWTVSSTSTSLPEPLQPYSPGLSTRAVAGIGVGVAVAVTCLVGLLWGGYRVRRRRRAAAAANIQAYVAKAPEPRGLQELHEESVRAEMWAHQVQRPPAELYGS